MTTYHVFGDTGGHYRQLRDGLIEIGLDLETHKLPEGVVVIHCGDLLHKGPSSPAVIYMVDNIMKANPGQWVQLLGNHEYQYVGGIQFWRENIGQEPIEILQSWVKEGRAKTAFALAEYSEIHDLTLSARKFATPTKPIIFTHAGITRQFWEKHLHSETDALKMAEMINTMPISVSNAPGCMLDSHTNTKAYPAGPVWALSTGEVWESWKSEVTEPFIQIHGHTSPYAFEMKKWWPANPEFKKNSKVNPDRKTLATRVSDSLHIAIDPSYNKRAEAAPQPSLKITT